jgi:hypothetical protein
MKVRTLALALSLAVAAFFGTAQASTPKHPKAPKYKAAKINARNENKFKASHNVPKRQAVKAQARHTAQKPTVRKFTKPKQQS